jgi:hypothetical protein
MFNLALSFKRRGMLAQAYDCILEALKREREAPYLVLQAQLLDQRKDSATRDEALAESAQLFGDVTGMSDWELHWFRVGAELGADKDAVKRAQRELQHRARRGTDVEVAGQLPGRKEEEHNA